MTAPIDIKPPSSIDHLPLREVTLAAIDLDRVAAHLDRAVAAGRYSGPSEPQQYLHARP